ncbi:PREDICTED: transcription factor bHLH112 isoform X3 [Fragaria vesca subsp. vesca]|uniref:transcription factor bHLH112 isoform X3 n=1 Tax=Fragaria vesca subsp. vesca TaxID=101020 RepID=UPI0002C362CC|nr:PREDICTED: transcription factor bHLH112 isoform X3 [Fragaria vesca subsp. vesca]
MAEEYQGGICGGNWWSTASRHALVAAASPCSVGFNDHMGSFGCPNDMDMIKSSRSTCGGFGLSSLSSTVPSDLNQALLLRSGSGRGESNFHNSMLPEAMGSFKQPMNNQDFSLDQSSSSSGFPITSSSANNSYGSGGFPSQLLQNLYDPEEVVVPQPQLQSLFNNGSSSMSYSSAENYGTLGSNALLSSPASTTTCWPRYSPSCLRPSLQPTQQQQPVGGSGGGGGLQFSNINTPFWNTPAAALNHDIRSTGLFPSLSQSQYTAPTAAAYDEHKPITSGNFTKANTNEDVQDSSSSTVKKSGSSFCSSTEPVFKRARIETPSPLPTFKVRKEKLGDRITALQQLVSPFGKTDTASVLHEAIEYIKFLHDQVGVLSTPYMNNGAPIQHQQGCDKLKEGEQGGKQDLQSRGLCLVPVSSTFPVANETTADFWTPTFGATTFR